MSTIVRSARRPQSYTIVDNDVIGDDRLSLRTRGLLVWILSKPDGWAVTADALAEHHREGQSAIKTALRELESAGYLVRVKSRQRAVSGRLVWVWETTVYDRPHNVSVSSDPTANVQVAPSVENRPTETTPARANVQVAPSVGFEPTENRPTEFPSVGFEPTENEPISTQVLKTKELTTTPPLASLGLPPEASSNKLITQGTRLPQGWLPDQSLIAWARSEAMPDEMQRTETAKFRDHWHAQPGAKGRRCDWPATWRNWMRRASEDVRRPPLANSHRQRPQPAGNPYLNDLRDRGLVPGLDGRLEITQ